MDIYEKNAIRSLALINIIACLKCSCEPKTMIRFIEEEVEKYKKEIGYEQV